MEVQEHQEAVVLQVLVVVQGHQEQVEVQVHREVLELMVHRELQVLAEVLAAQEVEVHREHQVLREQVEVLVHQEVLELLVHQVLLVHRVVQVQQEVQEHQVHQEVQVQVGYQEMTLLTQVDGVTHQEVEYHRLREDLVLVVQHFPLLLVLQLMTLILILRIMIIGGYRLIHYYVQITQYIYK